MTFVRGYVCCVAATLLLLTGIVDASTPAARFLGRPKFDQGRVLGYFVWRDGDTWKVRWTTFGATHRFSGRVVLEGGEIADLKRVDVDAERKIIAPGRTARVVRRPRNRVSAVRPGHGAVGNEPLDDRIVQDTGRTVRFNTETDDDIDGFDVKLRGDVREVRLVLEIDGVPRPADIEVGRENFAPPESPIVVLLN